MLRLRKKAKTNKVVTLLGVL